MTHLKAYYQLLQVLFHLSQLELSLFLGHIVLTTGVARIFQWGGGAKWGSEATERGKGVGAGFPLTHGREIFEISCIKMAFFAY